MCLFWEVIFCLKRIDNEVWDIKIFFKNVYSICNNIVGV